MKPTRTVVAVFVLITSSTSAARGQCTLGWGAAPDLTLLNGKVQCSVVFDDGSGSALYVGGDFTHSGATVLNRVARWRGLLWEPVGSGLTGPIGASVNCMAVYDNGMGPKLYAAGSFTPNAFAVWNGTSWTNLPALPCCGYAPPLVTYYGCCAVYDPPGPTPAGLYLGGTIAYGVARYDATGFSLVGSPGSLGGGCTSGINVSALHVHDDGTGAALYAGGYFTVPGNGMARWNGTAWSALPGPALTGVFISCPWVFDLLTFDDGSGPALYVGGVFSSAGALSGTTGIARFSGSGWSAVGQGFTMNGGAMSVSSLVSHDDGAGPALYAGGRFNILGAPGANNVAKWNGSAWSALATGVPPPSGASATVRELASFDEGNGPALFASASTDLGVDFVARWARPAPVLRILQIAGPGSPSGILDGELFVGHEYFNVFSLEPCAMVGSGPYFGLCASNVNVLLDQVLTPVGTAPFHFIPTAGLVGFGPYPVAAGITVDALAFDFTGGTVGCISRVARLTVQ